MRRSTTNVIIARAIAAAVAGILTVTTPMSVLAEDTLPITEEIPGNNGEQQPANEVQATQELDDRGSDSFHNCDVSTTEAQYNDNQEEVNKVTESAPSVHVMNEHVENAQDAVEDAQEQLKSINQTVADLNKQTGAGQADAAGTASTEVAGTASTETPWDTPSDIAVAEATTPKVAADYNNMNAASETVTEAASTVTSVTDALPDTLDTASKAKAAKQTVNSYNKTVSEDNQKIATDAQKDLTQVETSAAGGTYSPWDDTAADSGNAGTAPVQDAVTVSQEKASEALKEAENAKEALKKALDVTENADGSEITYNEQGEVENQEIKDAVSEARAAAVKAANAADAAEKVYDKAEDNLDSAVQEYNDMAAKYGLTSRYVKVDTDNDGVKDTYELQENALTKAEAKKEQKAYNEGTGEGQTTGAKIAAAQDLEDDINQANETFAASEDALKEAAENVADAQERYEAASEHFEAAKAAAEQAVTTVTNAANKIGDDAALTAAEAEAVNNYYVTPAEQELKAAQEANAAAKQAVEDAKASLANAQKTQTEKQNAYDTALSAARAQGNANFEARLQEYRTATANAQREYDDASFYRKADKRIVLEAARIQEWAFNTSWNRNNYVNSAINNSAGVNSTRDQLGIATNEVNLAQQNLTAAEAKKSERQAEEDSKQQELKDVTATRDQYLKEAEEAYKAQKVTELENAIKTEMLNQGVTINQLQFDEDLNTWANKVLNTLDVKTDSLSSIWKSFGDYFKSLSEKSETRGFMDAVYNSGNEDFVEWVKDVVNDTTLAQGIINTKENEKAMDLLYRYAAKTIVEQAEYLATVQANTANWTAQDLNSDAVAKLQNVQKQKDAIENLSDEVATVKGNYASALKNYNDAKENLDEIQENVKDLTLSKIDLAALQNQIEAAKDKLKTAKSELADAKAAADTADNFADWAESLLNKQTARAYAQITTDENGETVPAKTNAKAFDQSTAEVKSRSTSDFTSVSSRSVELPYNLYRTYVEAMTMGDTTYDFAAPTSGKGAAIGSTDNTVYYWELDEDGKLTGKYYAGTTDAAIPEGMPYGTYFVAYVLKTEADSKHLDGFEVTFEEPEPTPAPAPTPTPGDETTPTGGETTTETTATETTTATVTSTAVAASAATTDAPAVLGASRPAPTAETEEATEEGAVLGASRDLPAVLGASRMVTTGDEANTLMWGAIAMISAVLLSGWVLLHRRANR